MAEVSTSFLVLVVSWSFGRFSYGGSSVRWYHFLVPVWVLANAALFGFADEPWFRARVARPGRRRGRRGDRVAVDHRVAVSKESAV